MYKYQAFVTRLTCGLGCVQDLWRSADLAIRFKKVNVCVSGRLCALNLKLTVKE